MLVNIRLSGLFLEYAANIKFRMRVCVQKFISLNAGYLVFEQHSVDYRLKGLTNHCNQFLLTFYMFLYFNDVSHFSVMRISSFSLFNNIVN